MTTAIEWVKSPDGTQGCTVNSKTGCLNGCEYCYARKLANGRLRQRYLANKSFDMPFPQGGEYGVAHLNKALLDPFYPRWWPQRLEKIRRIKKPTGIFLDDMSDWMADYWPAEWTEQELQVMRDCPQHRFYTLTKQPQNLPREWPENCWLGVTATNGQEAARALGYFAWHRSDAPVRFLSIEPLLNWVEGCNRWARWFKDIEWIIIGACTGTLEDIKKVNYQHKDTDGLIPMPWGKKWTLQPRAEWVDEIVQAADKAGVKVFLKDNLNPLLLKDALSGQAALDLGLLNWEGQLRQELPEVV